MDQPIAIIGLDARFPENGDTAESFFDLLRAGRSARTKVPPERFDVDGYWHPDEGRAGSTRAKYGHFLKESISAFDAPFFAITASEAEQMDPQQRGMLVSVYRALENAGITVEAAAGSSTGVYVGCFTSDYNGLSTRDIAIPQKHAGGGTTNSMLSNRVSWFFDLKGPSLTIDTACSSSLVAAHQACVSLKTGEISMAVVGGCNLILSPEMTLKLDAASVLSPDGISYSFDHRANGYSRGEGFGTVVLKRVSDAIRDGDIIRAVIRNTGVNQDGKSPGITQPTKEAQAALIKSVYSKASLDPGLTRFFEAHGTGTIIGDSIEASAISEIFTPYRSADEPLYIGALKSNIGHLEGAAGVAALIKGVYTLEQGVISPNAWFKKANPKISDSWHLRFPTENVPWPQHGLRRMSLNSFGIGGTNAHIVLDDAYHFLNQQHLAANHRTVPYPCCEEAPDSPVRTDASSPRDDSDQSVLGYDTPPSTPGHPTLGIRTDSPQIFLISSFDQDGVSRQQESFSKYLSSHSRSNIAATEPSRFMSDLSFTLSTKRTQHRWRSYKVAKSRTALCEAWNELPEAIKSLDKPNLAFVFTGQGAQWATMGLGLMSYPVFQESLLDAEKYLNSIGCTWSLIYELCKDSSISVINEPEFCQPICTALQIALVELLYSWSIYPQAVVGHSSGEIAAAFAAGAISRESAWNIAFHRGRLCANLTKATPMTTTGMAAVALDLQSTRTAIERVHDNLGPEGSLEIACMNSYDSHTVSGDLNKIQSLVELLTSEGIFARQLSIGVAYHSRHMEPLQAEYLNAIGQIDAGLKQPDLHPAFYSSIYGTLVPLESLRSPEYWVTNLVSPVRFCEAATAMLQRVSGQEEMPITDILEIGPHSALKGPLRNIFKNLELQESVKYLSVIRRNESAVDIALSSAATLFCRGHNVDIPAINQFAGPDGYTPLMLTDLPGYAFDHSKEYWVSTRLSEAFTAPRAVRHELLGAPIPDWNKENAIWRNWIRVTESPWLEDHMVSGDILYPAAGMLVMAIEASRQIVDEGKAIAGFKFKEVSFHRALRVPTDDRGVESHFYMRPFRENNSSTISKWHEFQLYTMENGEWREHCRGLVQTEFEHKENIFGDRHDLTLNEKCQHTVQNSRESCNAEISPRKIYHAFRELGLGFGTTFQTIKGAYLDVSGSNSVTKVEAPISSLKACMPKGYLQPHIIHPATLDGILQSNAVPAALGPMRSKEAMVPVFLDELWVSAHAPVSDDSYIVASQVLSQTPQQFALKFTSVTKDGGDAVAYANKIVLKVVSGGGAQGLREEPNGSSYNIGWKLDPTFLNQEDVQRASHLQSNIDPSPPESYEECNLLCLLYMRRVIESDVLKDVGGFQTHHQKFFSWMHDCINETPLDLAAYSILEIEAKVTARGTPEGILVLAVGEALPEILNGTTDPLEVIFKDQRIENFYRYGMGARRCYERLCKYVDLLAHKTPSMDILEIGAGTGGVTKSIITTLTEGGKRYNHYQFTDISPIFFEQAKENFPDQVESMGFNLLDIERPPTDQGFSDEGYDLIVAANVLHATRRIDDTLQNVRKLLRPGGKLLLYELIEPKSILCTFIVGTLPGWWLSEDVDRTKSPLMSIKMWDQHLLGAGFSGVDIKFDGQLDSALISTALTSTKPAPVRNDVFILVNESSSLQDKVANGISGNFHGQSRCVITSLLNSGGDIPATDTSIILAELDHPFLTDLSDESLSAIKNVFKSSKVVIWVSRIGDPDTPIPDQQLHVGLAKTIRCERPDLTFITIDFAANDNYDTIISRTLHIMHHFERCESTENTFRVAGGLIHIPRLIKADYLNEHIERLSGSKGKTSEECLGSSDRALKLRIGTPGIVDTLQFEDDMTYDSPLGDHEVEIKVKACGVNFRDLTAVLGKIHETDLGTEASGIVTRTGPAADFKVGDEVFGLFFEGSMRRYARTHEGFLAKKPSTMSWVEVASIPVVYTTAYAVLHELGSLDSEETVLIHSAAGGLGQAAIQIALRKGAEIFVTVGSTEKRDFLEQVYKIPHDHIFPSRDLSFKSRIMEMTGSRGVDLILNTVSGEALKATWDCVAPFGRFVELGMGDVFANSRLPMENLSRNTRFEAFDLSFLANHNPTRAHKIFQRAVSNMFTAPADQRLKTPISTYPMARVVDAFRQLQLSKHIGKLVLELSDEHIVTVQPSRRSTTKFASDASYVIVGGFGGLGRSVARWMVSRGAKNLIILSRQGPQDEASRRLMDELRDICDNIAAPPCDVTDSEALRATITECLSSMPPIKGCIQGAMVLKDNRFMEMTLNDWNTALHPKIAGSKNLVDVLGQRLDFFIMLSSIAGVTGNKEQSNYAAGSSFQDAFARHLQQFQGLNAISISCPVILDVGFVAEKPELLDILRSRGVPSMNEKQFHAALDYHCQPTTQVRKLERSHVVPQLWLPQYYADKGAQPRGWENDPFFSHLTQTKREARQEKTSKDVKYAALLAGVASPQAAEQVALDALLSKLSKILSIDVSRLETDKPLNSYGVDSLVAVELRSWFYKELGAEFSVFEMTSFSSIHQLAETAAKRSSFLPVSIVDASV